MNDNNDNEIYGQRTKMGESTIAIDNSQQWTMWIITEYAMTNRYTYQFGGRSEREQRLLLTAPDGEFIIIIIMI